MSTVDDSITANRMLIATPPIADGTFDLADLTRTEFPTKIQHWKNARLEAPNAATHFGFVQSGTATLDCESGTFPLTAGMYFMAPGELAIAGNGCGILVSAYHYTGLFSLGGPVESTGRLRYIDGCTDTLLIAPLIQGDPCLNLLHIPPGTHQTQHTHPSLRTGVVVRGVGRCVTPQGTHPLSAGAMFMIPPNGIHSFHTDDQDLLIIAYHPDSDTGPTHDDHPMVNRTIVDGVSASHIDSIRTRPIHPIHPIHE